MGHVRILPEILSNKIAAGEVVERPVSVLKELLENALDAGATAVTVEIERGGRDLVRVSDNGRGMERDDAILSIERYATSKIATDDDLFSIRTFGFRGEALPSIASVSDFVLTTRTSDADAGTRVHIRGGKMMDVADTGAPTGTMVEVKNLYFNTPARRKFLKSINTEMGHIADAFSGIALGNPDIGFRLFHNGRPVKRFSASDDPLTRAGEVLGSQLSCHLCPVDLSLGRVEISGFVSDPSTTQTTPRKTRLFVNNRMISDRGVLSAVFRGYQGRIMKGRFPIALLFINLPVDQVDVNVHPSKLHVRFADSGGVYRVVVRAVQEALSVWQKQHYQGLATQPFDSHGQADGIISPQKISEPCSSETATVSDGQIFHARKTLPGRKILKEQPRVKESLFQWGMPDGIGEASPKEKAFPQEPERNSCDQTHSTPDAPMDEISRVYDGKIGITGTAAKGVDIYPAPKPLEEGPPGKAFDQAKSPTIIGQLLGLYILLESGDGMILLDQHAAHERVVYERLKKRSGLFRPPSQILAVPETLELDFREADLLEAIIPDLAALGITLESFGGNSFIVKAVPALIDDRDIRPLIRDMLGEIMASNINTGDKDQKKAWLDECLKLMACHHAIRAGKKMNFQEMEALVMELESCDNPYHCPHGRPTRVEWSGTDLQKMFKRIV